MKKKFPCWSADLALILLVICGALLPLSAQIVERGPAENETVPVVEAMAVPESGGAQMIAAPAVPVVTPDQKAPSEAEGGGEAPEENRDAIKVSSARNAMYEAMVNVQDGMYEEGIPKLEWVLEQDPTLLEAWETLGWAYWLTNREDDAIALWARLVEIAPNEPMGYNLMGQVETRNLKFEKARAYYQKSLDINPAQYEIRASLAKVNLWDGKWMLATRDFTQLLAEDPERTDIKIDLAWSLYGDEKYEESLKYWNEIVEVIPGHAGFLIARANVHLLMGMLEEAEQDAYTALEVEPDNLSALNILIALSIRNNRPQETVSRLLEVQSKVDEKENKIRVAQQLAVLMESVYEQNPSIFTIEEVVQAGKDAWDMDRKNVGSASFYAEALVVAKEFEAAANVFKYILDELNPHNDRALYGLMETYLGRAMIDEAEKQLVENLRIFNPENPFRHVYWSRIHFARGDFQLALKSLESLEREGARGAVFTLLYYRSESCQSGAFAGRGGRHGG